jgi:signal transduction histidine kinase
LPVLFGLLISALACGLLTLYLVRPLRLLRQAVNACATGHFEQRIAPLFGTRKDEIAALARDVDSMSAAISALLAGQRQLLHDVSHEIRSPLARMQVAAELAGLRTDINARELERIVREIGLLDSLVGELLAVERIGMTGALPQTKVDLNEVVVRVAADARYEFQADDGRIVLHASPGLWVRGDKDLLLRAIANLVRNAIVHGPTGAPVVLQASSQHGQILVQVDDTGTGIPPEQLESLFQPFVRLDASRNRQTGGFGLGLALVSRVVRWHGGQIRAVHLQPTGFRMEIQLPQVQPDLPSIGG